MPATGHEVERQVGQIGSRADWRPERTQAERPPLLEADVEIGGSDQLYNYLCDRDLQRAEGLDAQIVVTVPLLRGTDGRKMSKSSEITFRST